MLSRRAVRSLLSVLTILLSITNIPPGPAAAAPDAASSRPIEQSLPAPAPTGAGVTVAPAPVAAFRSAPLSTIPCESIWSSGLPRTDTGLTSCSEFSNERVNGADHRVFYPAEWDTDPTGGYGAAFMEPARAAIRHSAEVFGAYGTMGTVTLVFSINTSDAWADANLYELDGISTTSHEGCSIFVYPDMFPRPADQFQQAIAHEMFHCFQTFNFMKPGGAISEARKWWIEGSADYFSNVAYPAVNREWENAPALDNISPYTSLTRMHYAATFFFQYLGNTIGNKEIINFLATLPYAGSEADQQAAIRAYGGMEDRFQDYAQQYLDKTLLDTSGVPIPFNPTFTTVLTMNATGTSEITFEPFVIHRVTVAFDPTMTFTYSVAPTTGTSRHGYRIEGGAWGPAPSTIGCDDPHTYKAAFTSVGDGSTAKAVITATTAATSADCTPTLTDTCLVGDWRVADYAAFLQAALGMAGATTGAAPITLDGVSGDLWFAFDGTTLTYNAANFELSGSTVVQGMAVSVTVRLNGQASAGYGITAPGVITLLGLDTSGITVEAESTVGGSPMGVQPIPADQWIFFLSPTYGYTCNGARLDLTIPPLAVPVVFTKAT